MASPFAIVRILKSKKKEEYIFVHYALQKSMGWNVGWGDTERFTADEFHVDGLNQVLKSLEEFDSRDGEDQSRFIKRSNDEQRRITRNFLSVSVGIKDGLFCITPSHREKDGFIGEEAMQLDIGCSSDEFFEKMLMAFSLAS